MTLRKTFIRICGRWRTVPTLLAVTWVAYVGVRVAEQFFLRPGICWSGRDIQQNGVDFCETYFWHWTNDSMWSTGPKFEYLVRTDHLLFAMIFVPLSLWAVAFGLGWILRYREKQN